MPCLSMSMISSPACRPISILRGLTTSPLVPMPCCHCSSLTAGGLSRAERREADELHRHRHRVGGVLTAAGAVGRAGVVFEELQLLFADLAGLVGADRLVDRADRRFLAVDLAGQDRAAVEQEAGDVEPGQRQREAGQRLVAGAETDDRVEHVAAADQLDRVGDHLAGDERGLHALGAHRDAVGDGDRCSSPSGRRRPR